MKKESLIKKIITFFINIFKIIIITILYIIRSIFKTNTKKNKISSNKQNNKIQKTNKYINTENNNSTLPDDANKKDNNNSSNTENNTQNKAENNKTRTNTLPNIDNNSPNPDKPYFTSSFISALIDKELEETYKEEKFKVKDAPKEIKEKIKDLKIIIIPNILIKINKQELTTQEEIKIEVKKVVKIKLKEKPLLPKREINEHITSKEIQYPSHSKESLTNKINEEKTKKTDNIQQPITKPKTHSLVQTISPNNKKKIEEKEIYFIAKSTKKKINPKKEKPPQIKKENKITTLKENKPLIAKINQTPMVMIQNTKTIPKPKVIDNIKNAVMTSGIVATKTVSEIITTPLTKKSEKTTSPKIQSEEEKHKKKPIREENNINTFNQTTIPLEKKDNMDTKKENEKENNQNNRIQTIENTVIQNIKKDLEDDRKTIEELSQIHEQLKNKIEEIQKEPKQKEHKKENEEIVKDLIKDTEISAISQTSNNVINDSITETKKEEFEDKDYERIERQIDKMLEDISNTYLRYEGKMTTKQKAKLKAEEEKLRATREQIRSQKSQDLIEEQNKLNEEIHFSELNGLQEELKKIDLENKTKVSEELLRKMENLDGMTKETVAQADKKIMLKRFNKASLLLEMTSLLAFPFIRNKYFFAFTIGLIIDNHFNFINSFFRRKINKYEPADLSNIKRGKDALNSALDITYKNLVELDYLEQQALVKYPELAYDQSFINEVTRLRTNLNKKYNKLMKKNKNMEKYYMKTKYQTKILKKDLKSAQK